MSRLILPGHPEFDLTLGMALPPSPTADQVVFIARSGSGILEPATPDQAREYLWGGEYDERMAEVEGDEWQPGSH